MFRILKKNVEKTYNESPFKSIILDIRSILPKKGCKKIKKGLEYVEEMKELTFLQIENGKNNLIKLKNNLIEKFKKNIRIKKADRGYYEYEVKDVRNLFNQNDDDDDDDDDDDNYEGTEYLFDEGDVNELIESCELIEDGDEINDLIDYLEIIFNKTVEITFNESPFKSLTSDIRSILRMDGCKKLEKRLKNIRELRKSTTLEIKNIKNDLIKMKNKRINRNKKEIKDYY